MMPENQTYTASGQGTPWRVFVGFDDLQARKRATEVCDSLLAHFQPEFDFDLQLCDFNSFGEAECRRQAVELAARAQIVVFATCAKRDLAPPVLEWMEGLCTSRRSREGALVGLICSNAPAELRDAIETQLRQLSHRAGLDFLTHEPDCRSLSIREEPEWVEAHAAKIGSVLESILNVPRAPVAVLPGGP